MSYNSHKQKALDESQPISHRASHARSCAVCVCEKYGVSRSVVIDEVRKIMGIDLNATVSPADIAKAISALDNIKLNGVDNCDT